VIAREDLGVPATVTPTLPQGGVVDAFSAGLDACGTDVVIFFYSVDVASVGAGYPITPEVTTDGAAGDVFTLVTKGGCPGLRGPALETDAPEVVLFPLPAPFPFPNLSQDELSNVDAPFAYQVRKVPVYFSVDTETAGLLSAASGIPVTGGDILVSYRRGDWRIAMSHTALGLSAAADVDAIAVEESLPGVIANVYFSVRGPLGAASASGFLPSEVLQITVGSGSTPTVFLSPSKLGCLPTDDVDAMSILDPGLLFSTNYCFAAVGTGPCTSAGTLEEDPGGTPSETLWHPEGFCFWDGNYQVSGPFPTGPYASIVNGPGAFLVWGSGLDDPISQPLLLPGGFPFFGSATSDVQVSVNGFVAFDQNPPLAFSFFFSDPIPNSNPPNHVAAPWWDDLHTGSLGSVWAQPLPSGGFLVEWDSLEKYPWNSSGELASFQLELSPSPVAGTVKFRYGQQTFGSNPWAAAVGIENATGSAGIDATGLGVFNSSFPGGSFTELQFTPTGSPVPSPSGGWAMAYNLGDQGQYDYDQQSGGGSIANTGALVLPTGLPAGTKNLSLSFDYMKETEGSGNPTFDQCFVEMKQTFPSPAPNYAATPLAPSFASISGAVGEVVLLLPVTDDTTTPATPLPAPFSFFGVPKGSFQVNNNGWIAFDQALGGGFFTNAPIPTAAAPNDAIFPWWDDNYLFAGVGSVSTLVTGAGDLIVQWTSEGHFGTVAGSHNATFQAILHPSPLDTIEFRYDGASFVAGPAWSATIGVEDASGSSGLDVTGLGAANTGLPPNGFSLAPALVTPPGSPWNDLLPSTLPTPIAGNSVCPLVTTVTETVSTLGSNLASLLGNGGSLRFRFDTLDAAANNYAGWYIQNLCLQGGPVAFFQRYGEGCAPGGGSGGSFPRIGTSGPPVSPSLITITLANGPAGGAALLLLNVPFSMPLPVPLTLFGLPAAPTCRFEAGLFPFPLILSVPISAVGAASIPVAIPPGLPATDVFAQWFCVSPASTFFMSDAGIFGVR
jgi:hypothetical protein